MIDIDQSRGNIAHGGKSAVHILREDRSGEAILGTIVDLDGFFERIDFDDRKHGAKDLLTFQRGAWLDSVKQSRAIKETLAVYLCNRGADQCPCAFLLPDLHIVVDPL